MKFGSLFAGIGGLDLGLERAEMECAWQVEIDEWCRRVLAKHWPNVRRYGDVRECGSHNLEPVDLICGGFPCQPVSQAGQRKGEDDPRWLWPEFHRVLREIRPRWVLLENVPGLLSIASGRLFGGILRDLAESGYDAEWSCVSAAAVGAPHLRYRVFVVAHANGQELRQQSGGQPGQSRPGETIPANDGEEGSVADSDSGRSHSRRNEARRQAGAEPAGGSQGAEVADSDRERCYRGPRIFQASGTPGLIPLEGTHPRTIESSVGGTPDGLSGGLDGVGGLNYWAGDWERNVPRIATGVPQRVERLRSLGNAVVPQVAQWLGERILDIEQKMSKLQPGPEQKMSRLYQTVQQKMSRP